MSLALLALVSGHTYTHKTGYIGRGSDLVPPRAATLADAENFCSTQKACVAISFEGPDPAPTGTIPKVYFKKATDFFADSAWHSYLRDYVPPPPMLQNPCLNASTGQASLPWCNATLPISTRVADMIGRMSVAEKITQLGTESPGVPSLHLVKYDWYKQTQFAPPPPPSDCSHHLRVHCTGGPKLPTASRAATMARTTCPPPISPSPSPLAWPSTGPCGG